MLIHGGANDIPSPTEPGPRSIISGAFSLMKKGKTRYHAQTLLRRSRSVHRPSPQRSPGARVISHVSCSPSCHHFSQSSSIRRCDEKDVASGIKKPDHHRCIETDQSLRSLQARLPFSPARLALASGQFLRSPAALTSSSPRGFRLPSPTADVAS
jgi:hypothetical protein